MLFPLTIGFIGGMPMCHGAGGVAGQHYFGARTSGTSILEGLIELFLGLFLSRSVGNLLAAFPMLLVGELWASRLGWQWPMWYGR